MNVCFCFKFVSFLYFVICSIVLYMFNVFPFQSLADIEAFIDFSEDENIEDRVVEKGKHD